jgi:branched-chain amino acid transport system substrate-binding protein
MMHRKLTLTLLALTASLAVGVGAALAGTTGGKDDPGITPKSILLGGTAPLSGLASSYASVSAGAEAYFKYVNARGGVNGRTIAYKVLDDGYNAAQTVPLTRQLVEQDKVFAIFNGLGTENNLAVRPYLNSAKVPQLFVGSGGTTFGRDYAQYPDTIGFQPTYQAEGWVYGKYLAHMAPGTTIAVLFQKDDYGKDLLIGLKRGLQRSNAKVIAAQPYDPLTSADVSAQMAKLKASGADTLAIFATPAFVAQAYAAAAKLGWKPKHVINNSVGASSSTMAAASDGGRNKLVAGTISVAYLKDPNDGQCTRPARILPTRCTSTAWRSRGPRSRHSARSGRR